MPQVRKTYAKVPKESENNYVSYLYHAIDKGAVPTQEEFSIKVDMSKNVKKKFSLLQDVTDTKFHDLIVQVAREPYDLGDKVTLYVSDYTENDKFFEYTKEGVRDLDTRGDVWGYTTNKSEGEGNVDEWVGPYGKKAMQITVYEPHATYAREELRAGDWVYIKNVQIKYGADGRFLEGFLREARNLAASTNYMDVLDTHDLDNVDKKLRDDFKDAIRRWRDYSKKEKADDKRIKGSERGSCKRKHNPDSDVQPTQTKKSAKPNSRSRRDLKREKIQKKVAEEEARAKAKAEQDRAAEVQALNSAIVCEHPDKPITPVSGIVEHIHYETIINGAAVTLILPFVNQNYRANVRVVDFFPDRLEDFASFHRMTQFDVLSENSDEDSDSSSGSESEAGSRRRADQVWEWRFALLLEDARRNKSSNPAQRVWVIVDNLEGQYLTGLDASDLRQDKNNLTTLRERMFCLWGGLEEHKHGVLGTREERMRQRRKPGTVPPPTASDAEDDERGVAGKDMDVSNAAFGCCIRQYGVKVQEENENKADAGRGKRWERVYGLFGTKICF
jgi:hypothetical protein